MAWDQAFNEVSYQNAILLISSVPKYTKKAGDKKEEKKGINAGEWLKSFIKPDKKNDGKSISGDSPPAEGDEA